MKRLAVDIGGTFTDAVVVDDETGQIRIDKAPSTPDDYAVGLLDSVRQFTGDVPAVTFFAHGTTVCLNAILQNKTAPTAIVTTKGFRDVIEIQRSNRTDIYDPMYRKPKPLIPRHRRYEVAERMRYDGSVMTRLDEAELAAVAEKIKADGVQAVAIAFINSYANNQHESAAEEIVATALPGVYVTKSTDVTREYREYERSTTAVFNAGLMPIMRSYLGSLEAKIGELGYQHDLFIMQSNGGVMTSTVAKERPVFTINSGLVGGVIGTKNLAAILGYPHAIGTDMGGTSFDVCLIVGGEYRTQPLMKIRTPFSGNDAYPILVPTVDVNAIGAGGGSIAWIDVGGGLHVGPHSAGAVPGPACYGHGGTGPTTTDANLALGRLNAANFLGGKIPLYADRAKEAVKKISDRYAETVEKAAEGILAITVTNMANAIRTMTVNRGIDPRDFVLFSYGGAGPLHASLIARELGIGTVVVPPLPANFCAWGMLAADLKHDYNRTMIAVLDDMNLAQVNRAFADMEAAARATLNSEDVADDRKVFARTIDVRYLGQGHALGVGLPNADLADADRAKIAAQFDDLHLKTYLFNAPNERKEIVSLRLSAVGQIKSPGLPKIGMGQASPQAAALKERRQVYYGGAWRAFDIYDRAKLLSGNTFDGPAIIEEDVSTSLVLPEQNLKVDPYGNLILTWTES